MCQVSNRLLIDYGKLLLLFFIQMYLSADSLATVIVTAKSSEMNVLIPTGEDFVS